MRFLTPIWKIWLIQLFTAVCHNLKMFVDTNDIIREDRFKL